MKKHNRYTMTDGKKICNVHAIHLGIEWKIPCLNPNRYICARSWEVWLRDERLIGLFNGKGFS